MSKPRYQASIVLDQEDLENKEKLRDAGISMRDAWRTGVEILLKNIALIDKDKKA